MSDDMLTTEEVREDYAVGSRRFLRLATAGPAFDRWLAGVIAEERAKWEAEQQTKVNQHD